MELNLFKLLFYPLRMVFLCSVSVLGCLHPIYTIHDITALDQIIKVTGQHLQRTLNNSSA